MIKLGLNKNMTKTKSKSKCVSSVAHNFFVRVAPHICAVFTIDNLLIVPKSVMGFLTCFHHKAWLY